MSSGQANFAERTQKMDQRLIDVWNVGTFDSELAEELRQHQLVLCNYVTSEMEIMGEYVEAREAGRWKPQRSNPYAGGYHWLVEHVMDYMERRAIRAWHYSRLTDDEAIAIRRDGIYLGTLATIRARLDARLQAGDFSAAMAEALFAASPFQSEQLESRSNKFWMSSHPLDSDDGGVELLLSNWGGEAVYFWLKDEGLKGLVARLGRPRVIVVAVPVHVTNHSYAAAESVLAAFARSLGCRPDRDSFDLYSTRALGPEAVIRIHTAGEEKFAALGRGYPASFRKSDAEPI